MELRLLFFSLFSVFSLVLPVWDWFSEQVDMEICVVL